MSTTDGRRAHAAVHPSRRHPSRRIAFVPPYKYMDTINIITGGVLDLFLLLYTVFRALLPAAAPSNVWAPGGRGAALSPSPRARLNQTLNGSLCEYMVHDCAKSSLTFRKPAVAAPPAAARPGLMRETVMH